MAFAQGLAGRDASVLGSAQTTRPILASGRPGAHKKLAQKQQLVVGRRLSKDIQIASAAATVEETSTSYAFFSGPGGKDGNPKSGRQELLVFRFPSLRILSQAREGIDCTFAKDPVPPEYEIKFLNLPTERRWAQRLQRLGWWAWLSWVKIWPSMWRKRYLQHINSRNADDGQASGPLVNVMGIVACRESQSVSSTGRMRRQS